MLRWLKSLFCRKKKLSELEIKELEDTIESLKNEVNNKNSIVLENEKTISSLNQEAQKNNSIIQEAQEDILRLEKEVKSLMDNIQKKKDALDSKNAKLEFIANVINALPEKNPSYEKYLKLLKEDYIKYANENDALAAEANALLKLQSVAKQLEILSYDEALLNKNIVAIAGSFSSGKSSFMNSFFTTRKIELPIGTNQTTAISSYVMNGTKSITGYSYKGGKVNISDEIFTLFSYDKVDEFNFNMKQIINHIVVRNEFVKEFNNLCFIDTPGFNAGQETDTDYETATTAIATANSIIWCIDVGSGTIKGDECDILYDIFIKNENIGIYVVLNKADLKSDDENIQVMDLIENQMTIKGIPFEGISLYSSNSNYGYTFINQPESFNYYKGVSLSEFLENYNVENKQKEKNLLKQVDEVFEEYINADNQRIAKLENQIRTLKILENSFSSINDSKDDQIAYYKARIDTKHFQQRHFAEPMEKDEDLFNSLADLKSELKQTIEKDTSDIEKATELCTNMKKAVSEVFGHKLSANKNISEDKSKDSITAPHWCNNCGKENKPDAKFCLCCGRIFL